VHRNATSEFAPIHGRPAQPGNGGKPPLLIELPGASHDYGYQGITLTMPDGYACPQGTVQVN
jgi:hypothetical protein